MKNIMKVILVGIISLVSSSVFAATISVDDTFNITGQYSATGGSDLSDANFIKLGDEGGMFNPAGTATGDFAASFAGWPPPTGTAGAGTSLVGAPASSFFSIAGWTLDLTTLNVIDQELSLLTLSGTGVLTGNAFDATEVIWNFSAESATNFSMIITSTGIPAVPVPAAVWLFGSGLLGLVGIARRKA